MKHAVIHAPRAGHLVFVSAFACAGCSGLLGLDDKNFSGSGGSSTTSNTATTTTTGTGGAGGVGTGGVGTGGVTGGTGGVTGGTGGVTGGTGGVIATGGTGGVVCDPGPHHDQLTDEFDFTICKPDTGATLEARGFHLAWHDEMYSIPNLGLFATNSELRITTPQPVFWYDGERGPYIQKPLTGSFMVVADVALFKSNGTGLPEAVPQSGIGLLVRDPASAGNNSLERWISIDRGLDYDVITGMYTELVHGSWSNGNGGNDQGSMGTAAPAAGRVAICRDEQMHFHLWAYINGAWTEPMWTYGGLEAGGMPMTVQAGIFLYAYKKPANVVINGGVRGTTYYVRQYDLMGGSCDPTVYEP